MLNSSFALMNPQALKPDNDSFVKQLFSLPGTEVPANIMTLTSHTETRPLGATLCQSPSRFFSPSRSLLSQQQVVTGKMQTPCARFASPIASVGSQQSYRDRLLLSDEKMSDHF